jgi:hypothetical protein
LYFVETTAAAIEDTNRSSVDASWEAGIHRAKPGIFMPAFTMVDDVYRQEWLLGDAVTSPRSWI